MKLLIGAIALACAVPAAAQTAPAQMEHSQHQAGSARAPNAHAEHSGHQMPQSGSHEGHSMKDGCCADKDGNGKMDCCEEMAAKTDDQPSPKPQGQ
jgi:hypothetical protein